MYNPQLILELMAQNNVRAKDLLNAIGKNWNGSIEAVIKGDIRVSKLEKIADYFGVPLDTFFERSKNPGLLGQINRPAGLPDQTKIYTDLLLEKDKRIALLEEMIALLKERNSSQG